MEELDGIPLIHIMNKLALQNSSNFTYTTTVGEIFVQGEKWKNYTTKIGGRGPIELVMHLLNYDREKACNWLTLEFNSIDTPLNPSPGFYWIKCRPGGRWEVAEFDGVAWLSGPGDGGENYIIGPRIDEPKH